MITAYTGYESDHTGAYSLVVGVEVISLESIPSDMTGLTIPAGQYSRFTAQGPRLFEDLSEQGAVQMPLQETDWARRFGVLTDQFGTPWIINGDPPA